MTVGACPEPGNRSSEPVPVTVRDDGNGGADFRDATTCGRVHFEFAIKILTEYVRCLYICFDGRVAPLVAALAVGLA